MDNVCRQIGGVVILHNDLTSPRPPTTSQPHLVRIVDLPLFTYHWAFSLRTGAQYTVNLNSYSETFDMLKESGVYCMRIDASN